MTPLFRGPSTAAIDGLYRRHAVSVYRYAFAVLGNRADAEDVTQQTFLNAYRSLAQGTKPRKAENWLLTIAHNELRQHFRSTQSKPLEVELDDRLAQPAQEPTEPSLADILRALQHLPPAQRSALVMREFEGRSYAEMAQILDVTPSALEALIFRARRSLAEQLDEALTCVEAEQALSRRLDGRLPWREARRLKAHVKECPRCASFEQVQQRQRTLLKGLSFIPVPASLLLARGETAAAALGIGGAAAAAGGSAAVGAGGVGGAGVVAGLTTGLAAKAAAITAAAAVAGGVGYEVSERSDPVSKAERKAAHAVAVAQTRNGGRAAEVKAANARGERPGPARPASSQARIATSKATQSAVERSKAVPTRTRAHGRPVAKPKKAARVAPVVSGATKKPRPATPAATIVPRFKPTAPNARAKPRPVTPAATPIQRVKPAVPKVRTKPRPSVPPTSRSPIARLEPVRRAARAQLVPEARVAPANGAARAAEEKARPARPKPSVATDELTGGSPKK
jgi:RNA polymerase sigma factor (sigma-70 family)